MRLFAGIARRSGGACGWLGAVGLDRHARAREDEGGRGHGGEGRRLLSLAPPKNLALADRLQ